MSHLLETDVVVVGGGVTGVAVLRDLALRGVQAVLVERFDLGTGTSGRAMTSTGETTVVGPPAASCGRAGPAARRSIEVESRTTLRMGDMEASIVQVAAWAAVPQDALARTCCLRTRHAGMGRGRGRRTAGLGLLHFADGTYQ